MDKIILENSIDKMVKKEIRLIIIIYEILKFLILDRKSGSIVVNKDLKRKYC